MIINTIIPLPKVGNFPARQVGKKSHELAKLLELKIKTYPGFVIPTETIKQIAHHNGVTEKIRLLEETGDWETPYACSANLKKIRLLIKAQQLPEDVSTEIITAAAKLLTKHKFLLVQAGERTLENIVGSANLIESILTIWAQAFVRGSAFPPILVVAQAQPQASGVAKLNPEQKNQVVIKAVSGVYDHQLGIRNQPDQFAINLQTGAVVSRHLHPRTTILSRDLDRLRAQKTKASDRPAITDSQAQAIAKICQDINRHTLGRQKIYFEIVGTELLVSNIIPQAVTVPDEKPVLVIGQSVTGGVVSGLAKVVDSIADAQTFATGQILVKKSLDHLDTKLVLQAAALIIEDKSLPPIIIKTIQDYHIPCLVGATYATTKLQTPQIVVVDAGAGRVFAAPTTSTTPTATKTITKVYLSAGNPHKIQEYGAAAEGIFLKSDYLVAFQGVHPNLLLKTKKRQFAESLQRAITTFAAKSPDHFFYRSCNLNSAEFASLQGSANYETTEINPYLGTRGALKIIQDETLFAAELEIVNGLATTHKKTINLVIPFVRTATEMAILLKKIDQLVPQHPYLKIWLQLNTPANVFNLNEFLSLPISGITIQAKTIHDLTYGLDPDNPDLNQNYSFDQRLLVAMLESVATAVKTHPNLAHDTQGVLPVILKLNTYQSELVAAASRLGFRAVVVKPSLFAIVKQQLIATQKQMLNQSKH